jgi:hypothetical protein
MNRYPHDVGRCALSPRHSKSSARLAGLPRGRPTRWTQKGQLPAMERSRAGPAVWRARVGQAADSRHDSGGQSQPEPTFRFFIRSILSCLNKGESSQESLPPYPAVPPYEYIRYEYIRYGHTDTETCTHSRHRPYYITNVGSSR